MPYRLRLKFFAPPGTTIEPLGEVREDGHREFKFEMNELPGRVVLIQEARREGAWPTEPIRFILETGGYPSHEAAELVGRRLKARLSAYSAAHTLGFNLGNDKITSQAGPVVVEAALREGVQLLPTVHGLQIWEDTLPAKRIELRAQVSVTRQIRGFPSNFEALKVPHDPKLIFALALFNGVTHENDVEVKFLSLVTILEVLAERRERSAAAIAWIDWAREQGAAGIATDEWGSICGALREAKQESITSSVKRLAQVAGQDVQYIGKVYSARSELVHRGRSKIFDALGRNSDQLQRVVRSILDYLIEREALELDGSIPS